MERPPRPVIAPDRKAIIDRHFQDGLSIDVRNAYIGIIQAIQYGLTDLLERPGFAEVVDYQTFLSQSTAYTPAERQYITQHSDSNRVAEFDRLAAVANAAVGGYRCNPGNQESAQHALAALGDLEALFKNRR